MRVMTQTNVPRHYRSCLSIDVTCRPALSSRAAERIRHEAEHANIAVARRQGLRATRNIHLQSVVGILYYRALALIWDNKFDESRRAVGVANSKREKNQIPGGGGDPCGNGFCSENPLSDEVLQAKLVS